jgi:hypothetical protein
MSVERATFNGATHPAPALRGHPSEEGMDQEVESRMGMVVG